MKIYKSFEEWKAGQWLEDGELRTEAYTEDELLLVEMGWKYGFDAGKKQIKQGEPVAWMQTFESGDDKRMSLDFERIGINDIPLYTTPQTKPLSDEEIVDMINHIDSNPNDIDFEIRFARAIEERYGIK